LALLIPAIACNETEKPLSYRVTSATFTPERTWQGLGPDCGMHFNIVIQNTDTRPGLFNVDITYSNPSGVRHGYVSVDIQPGEWQTAYYFAGLMQCDAITDWHYKITPFAQ
jgi:hypothetical protein